MDHLPPLLYSLYITGVQKILSESLVFNRFFSQQQLRKLKGLHQGVNSVIAPPSRALVVFYGLTLYHGLVEQCTQYNKACSNTPPPLKPEGVRKLVYLITAHDDTLDPRATANITECTTSRMAGHCLIASPSVHSYIIQVHIWTQPDIQNRKYSEEWRPTPLLAPWSFREGCQKNKLCLNRGGGESPAQVWTTILNFGIFV